MKLLLLIFLSVSEPKLCKYRVVVYRNSIPTCTFSELKRITIEGYDRTELYTNIQHQVCALNGHALLVKSESHGHDGMAMTGIVVRCNVPFLLPSDLKPRE